jgi:hypothetical protein
MKIVCITAPCNGSGKTSLLCSILESFPGRFAALKCSTIYPEETFCPTSGGECACRQLDGEYAVISDPAVLLTPDTDTADMARAGARQTLWGVARPSGFQKLWETLQARHLDASIPLLCEGNTLAASIHPDFTIFVAHPGRPREIWKENSLGLLLSSNRVIINSDETQRATEEALYELGYCGPEIVTADVRRPLSRWKDPGLRKDIAALLDEDR